MNLKYKLGIIVSFYLVLFALSFINFSSANYNSLLSLILLAIFVVYLLLLWGTSLRKNILEQENTYKKTFKYSTIAIAILIVSILWTYLFYSGAGNAPVFDPIGPVLVSVASIFIIVSWVIWIKGVFIKKQY